MNDNYNKALSIVSTKKELLETIKKSFTLEIIDKLIKVSELIVSNLKAGGTIYVCGNGGSAEQSNHFVGEMVGRLRNKYRGAYKFESLCSNTATITALANDREYFNVFKEQIRGRFNPQTDVLIAISTSGNSDNIYEVVDFCKRILKTSNIIGLTGNNLDSYLASESNINLWVNSSVTERIQEVHMMYLHEIARLVEEGMEYANN